MNRSRSAIRWPLPAVLVSGGVVAVAAVALASSGTTSRHTTTAPTRATSADRAAAAKRTPASKRVEPTQAGQVPRLRRMLGQMIVARFSGTAPSPSLLARVRAGEVGGVILFADNLAAGLPRARSVIARMQLAARQGGNPPLLVMTDQEGGEVRRLPGPPTPAPSDMTTPATAFAQGQAAGRLLRSVGVNVDLAPVADVERVAGSFLGTRAFGSTPAAVAARACAFARGLASEHVAYTLKHFPGLGRATGSTDLMPVWIDAQPSALRADYAPYRSCARGRLALVMVSSAIYPSLTGPLPAVMSPLTYAHELRIATAEGPVLTISDDLQAGALARVPRPALHAIDAGLDLLLYASTEQASARAYALLLLRAHSGAVSATRIRAAYEAIAAFKRGLSCPCGPS